MSYRRILTIQDISCVGQCSMTVALPILSACGHEVCVLPTAVLSTHTGGFGKPAVTHLTELFDSAVSHWKQNDISFDVIYTGYLGSVAAIDMAMEIVDTMLSPDGIVVVDPAMADHGKLYSGLDETYANKMAKLCMKSHVMIPNLTEAAMMSGMEIPDVLSENYIAALLAALGGRDVVLTGVGFQEGETGAAVRSESDVRFALHQKIGTNFHGTGDIYASALVGALACGRSLAEAASIAGDFTCAAIRETVKKPAHWYGVKFEKAIPELIRLLHD